MVEVGFVLLSGFNFMKVGFISKNYFYRKNNCR